MCFAQLLKISVTQVIRLILCFSLLSQVSDPDAHICGLSLYPPSFHLLGGKGFQQILFFLLCNSSFSSFLSFSLQGVFPWVGHLHLAHLRVLLLPLLHSAGPSILSHRKFIDSITFLLQAIGLFRHPLNSVVVGTIGTKYKILFEHSCIFEQAWPIHSHMEPLVFSTRQWCPTTLTPSCSSTCSWSWPPAASSPSSSLPASPLLLLESAMKRKSTSYLFVKLHLALSTPVLWSQSNRCKINWLFSAESCSPRWVLWSAAVELHYLGFGGMENLQRWEIFPDWNEVDIWSQFHTIFDITVTNHLWKDDHKNKTFHNQMLNKDGRGIYHIKLF